eukprot:804617-Amphidinium_carterae.1
MGLCHYDTKDNTVGMMQKMNIKLPTPTQFDGRNPQFNEWAGVVKAHLSIHNVHIEDYMDAGSRSVATIVLSDIQDEYTEGDTRRLNTRFPAAPREDADNYVEYYDMAVDIRKKKDDISNFSQTLNWCFYIPRGFVKGVMRSWDSNTKHFTKQHHKWLEDINRSNSTEHDDADQFNYYI